MFYAKFYKNSRKSMKACCTVFSLKDVFCAINTDCPNGFWPAWKKGKAISMKSSDSNKCECAEMAVQKT